MKRHLFILSAMILAAASCTKKEPVEGNIPQVPQENPVRFSIMAQAADEPLAEQGTKLTYSENTDHSGIHWEVDETIGLVNESGNYESDGLLNDNRTEDGNKGLFTISNENVTAGGYTLYHPYNAESVAGAVKYSFAAEQTQNMAGFMDNGELRLPVISNGKVTLSEEKAVDATFKVVGTLLRFFVYGGEEGEQIKKVAVTTPSNIISGSLTVNDADGEITYPLEGGHDVSVTLNNASNANVVKDGAKGIYMMVMPTKIAAASESNFSLRYKIYTNKAVYYFNSVNPRDWQTSTKYDVYINLKSNELNKVPLDSDSNFLVPEKLYAIGKGATGQEWSDGEGVEFETKDGIRFTKQLPLSGDEFRFRARLGKGEGYVDNYFFDGTDGRDDKLKYSHEDNGSANFKVAAGEYKVTVDFNTKKVSYDLICPDNLYIIGNKYGWTVGSELRKFDKDVNNPYLFKLSSKTLDKGEYRLMTRNTGDYSEALVTEKDNYGKLEYTAKSVVENQNMKLYIPGLYDLTVDYKNKTFTEELKSVEYKLYVYGTGIKDVGWSPSDKAIEMDKKGLKFTKELSLVKDGKYHFSQEKSYNKTFGNSNGKLEYHSGTTDDNFTVSVDSGDYLMTVDLATREITLEPRRTFYLTGAFPFGGWSLPGVQMTTDYANKRSTWTGDLGENPGQFKIHDYRASSWATNNDGILSYNGDGFWLYASDKNANTVSLASTDAEYCTCNNTQYDSQWKFSDDFKNKNVTITLDWDDWENIKLSFKVNE